MKLTITKTPFLYIAWAFVILSMFLSGFIEISKTDYSITIWFKSQVVQHDALLAPVSKFIWVENMSKSELNKSFEKYLDEKKDNSDRWMTWMSILSTIFAVFFVYSGFKIDNTVKAVDGHEKRMRDIHEYTVQLEYCMSFIIQKQYGKAIDALEVLRREGFVWNDSYKKNTCNFFLAHCYYERWSIDKSLDDLTLAVQYINEAIPDESAHPFKIEIIDKFKEFDIIKT